MVTHRESAPPKPRRTATGARESASPKPPVSGKPEADPGASPALLEGILVTAQQYRREGNLRGAMELYWSLAEDHPGTAEADAAKADLLQLAAKYQRDVPLEQRLATAQRFRSEGKLLEATAEAAAGRAMLLELAASYEQGVLLEQRLAMAQRYRSEGNLRGAMDVYWKLAEGHPGTAEADAAKTRLLEMAAKYERDVRLEQRLAKAQQYRSEGKVKEATAEAEAARALLQELAETYEHDVLLERLLVMAQNYRGEGKLREAMEMYWELVEDHPGTAQADAAKAVLLEMAGKYGRGEAPHMARSIYERLLADGAS